MTPATDQDIREIKSAIADLTASISGLREEMRVGFTDLKGDLKVLVEEIGFLENWTALAVFQTWAVVAQ
jgi:hypothetical protein